MRCIHASKACVADPVEASPQGYYSTQGYYKGTTLRKGPIKVLRFGLVLRLLKGPKVLGIRGCT